METRHWDTKIRGRVAIHAARTFGTNSWGPEMEKALGMNQFEASRILPSGCILAVAELIFVGTTETWNPPDEERPFGDYSPGRFIWVFRNIQRLCPVEPCRGFQRFWNLPEATASQVERTLLACPNPVTPAHACALSAYP
jgi:hypothetical protein